MQCMKFKDHLNKNPYQNFNKKLKSFEKPQAISKNPKS